MRDIQPLGHEFVSNPEPRCPCVLLVDTSSSMEGRSIAELNDGLRAFADTLQADALASKRVEVAILTFSSNVTVVQEFTTVDRFAPPTLRAGGTTAMVEGLRQAMEVIEERRGAYRAANVQYYRPWLFLVTDGQPTDAQGHPTDAWRPAADELQAYLAAKKAVFFGVGTSTADFDVLRGLAGDHGRVARLHGLQFREFFLWLSTSQTQRSRETPGAQVALPPISNWGSAET